MALPHVDRINAIEDLPSVERPLLVRLDWGAPAQPDEQDMLRAAIGARYGIDTLEGSPVPKYDMDADDMFGSALHGLDIFNLQLWLRHGHDIGPLPTGPGIHRVESSGHDYWMVFCVRPKGESLINPRSPGGNE